MEDGCDKKFITRALRYVFPGFHHLSFILLIKRIILKNIAKKCSLFNKEELILYQPLFVKNFHELQMHSW